VCADSDFSGDSRAEHAHVSPLELGQPRRLADALYRLERDVDAAFQAEKLVPAKYFNVEMISLD
jgi:hypothetical protein